MMKLGRSLKFSLILVAVEGTFFGGLCSRPGLFAASPPTSRPSADAPDAKVLANKTIQFSAPQGWDAAATAATDLSAAYLSSDHASLLAVEVLPVDAHISSAAAGAIIKSLRKTREQRHEQLLQGPAVEKDPRFLLRIHEKFQAAGDKAAEQLHLYRQVGPRVVMVTLKTTAEAGDDVNAVQKTAEETCLSGTFVRPATK